MCVFVHVHVSAHLESDVILARWNMLEYSEYPTGALGGRGWGNMSCLMRVSGTKIARRREIVSVISLQSSGSVGVLKQIQTAAGEAK